MDEAGLFSDMDYLLHTDALAAYFRCPGQRFKTDHTVITNTYLGLIFDSKTILFQCVAQHIDDTQTSTTTRVTVMRIHCDHRVILLSLV